MVKKVKKNVTNDGTNPWQEALRDAEKQLEKAQRIIASWKATIQICRKRVAEGAAWPRMQSQGQDSGPQHSE